MANPIIEFKLNKKTYHIDKLTLEKSNQILEFASKSDIASLVRVISILSNCAVEELYELNKGEFDALWKAILNKVLVVNKIEAPKSITLSNGLEVFLIDINKLTISEFADIEFLNALTNNTHKILSILYRPKSKGKIIKYDSEVCSARADMFLELEMDIVKSIESFFLHIVKTYTNRLVRSLISSTQKKEPSKVNRIQKNLLMELEAVLNLSEEDGNPSSTHLQEILSSTLEQLNKLKS